MKKIRIANFCIPVLLFVCCNNVSGNKDKTTRAASSESISTKDDLIFKLEKVADSLYGPLALENAHDGSGRIFVGE